jgi:Protein of unknown function (DUF3349)
VSKIRFVDDAAGQTVDMLRPRKPGRRVAFWRPPLKRIRRMGRPIIEWVRAGYPEDAPKTGYNPVIALTGPMSLTQRQTQQVLTRLRGRPTDPVSIDVAITEITGHLPNPTQTRSVVRAIERIEPDSA